LTGVTVREARRFARRLRDRARGRDAQQKVAVAERIETLCERAEKVCAQIKRRLAGQKMSDRWSR
jgi:predicted nucleic acid-binding protein